MNNSSRYLLALAAGATILFPARAVAGAPVAPRFFAHAQERQDLASIFRTRPDLTTFRSLTETYGVTEPLRLTGVDEKGYTLFVPSDRAFAKLAPQALEELRRNRGLMQQVLKYHMVAGRMTSSEVKGSTDSETLQGESLSVRKSGNRVYAGRAMVIEADQLGSNGVIHVIDQVLLPQSIRDNLIRRAILPLNDGRAAELGRRQNAAQRTRNLSGSRENTSGEMIGRAARLRKPTLPSDLVELAVSTRDLTTFHRLATEAGIANWLMESDYTVFAPTNDAFANVPTLAMDALVADKELLKEVLTYHVVRGKIPARDLRRGTMRSAGEGTLAVRLGRHGAAKVNDAIVLDTDLMAQNGVLHTIHKVLMPPSVVSALRAKGITIGN